MSEYQMQPKSKYAKIIQAIVIIGLIVLFLWALAYTVWFVGIKETYNYLVNLITNMTGVNTFLAKALLILIMVPLFWGIRHLFSLKSKKRLSGLAIVAIYFFVFNISMFFITKDQSFDFSTGEAMQFCALTPDGISCHDKPGVDPKWGVELEKMTPDKKKYFAQIESKLQNRNYTPISISENSIIFDPITGDPLLWYSQSNDGKFRFFDAPGFDPASRTPLQAVTPESIAEFWQRIEDQKIQLSHLAEIKKQEELIAAQYALEQQKQKEVENQKKTLSLLFARSIPSSDLVDVAIIVNGQTELDRQSAKTIEKSMAGSFADILIHDKVFLPNFRASEYFQAFVSGDFKIIHEAQILNLLTGIEAFLAGNLKSKCSDGFQGTIKCDLTLNYQYLDKSGTVLESDYLSSSGPGFTQEEAIQNAVSKLISSFQDRTKSFPSI